jgi:hypothetical protein
LYPPPGSVPPTVPIASLVDWARAVQMAAKKKSAAAARGAALGAAQALQGAVADLLALPAHALSDTGASRGRTRWVVAHLKDFLAGDVGTAPGDPSDFSHTAPAPHHTAPPPHKLPRAPIATSSSAALLGQPGSWRLFLSPRPRPRPSLASPPCIPQSPLLLTPMCPPPPWCSQRSFSSASWSASRAPRDQVSVGGRTITFVRPRAPTRLPPLPSFTS